MHGPLFTLFTIAIAATEAALGLALVLVRVGQEKDARSELKEAARWEPDHPAVQAASTSGIHHRRAVTIDHDMTPASYAGVGHFALLALTSWVVGELDAGDVGGRARVFVRCGSTRFASLQAGGITRTR